MRRRCRTCVRWALCVSGLQDIVQQRDDTSDLPQPPHTRVRPPPPIFNLRPSVRPSSPTSNTASHFLSLLLLLLLHLLRLFSANSPPSASASVGEGRKQDGAEGKKKSLLPTLLVSPAVFVTAHSSPPLSSSPLPSPLYFI